MSLSASVIEGFAGSLLSKRYDGATPVPECHKQWWDICCSERPLVAIAAPRNHGKSTAITHAYVLANVVFRERKFVVLVSDTETQAVDFLRDLKEELRNNDDLIALFHIKGFVKDTETDIVVEFEDGQQFRILTRGSEQRMRGLKWNQMRPDLIVCDDLESEELVYNKDRREKFRKWFNGALLPCRAKHGIVRVVGTILHLDSLLNRLMPELHDPLTKQEELRDYNFSKARSWAAVRYRAYNSDFSKLLWSTRYDADFFIKDRDRCINEGIPEIHAQEYLNYPIDERTSYFKRGDFVESTPQDKERNKRYYAATDFAISTGDRSDFTVIAIAGVDEEGRIHVEDIRRGRWDALEIIDEMFSVEKRYHPELFVVERGAIEKAIGSVIRSEMFKRGVFLNLYPMTPTKDKQSRARSLQARLRSGGVRFNKEADWYPELEDEMVRFPKSRHDDQVDALSYIGLVLDEVQSALTPQEQANEEYEEELAMDSFYNGRNATTGY